MRSGEHPNPLPKRLGFLAFRTLRCCEGFNGNFTWEHLDPGDACAMVPCSVTHSVQQDDSTCLCKDGFTGSIQWKDGKFEGTCSPAPCYIQHTNGKDGTECACAAGFIGNITWNRAVPDGVGGTCFRSLFFLGFSLLV